MMHTHAADNIDNDNNNNSKDNREKTTTKTDRRTDIHKDRQKIDGQKIRVRKTIRWMDARRQIQA